MTSARFMGFGEMLMRLSAPSGERLLQSDGLRAHFVGAEANVMVSLACLGNDTAFVTVLPENALGDACMRAVREHGVSLDHVRRTAGRMATYYFEPGAMMRPSSILYDRKGSAFAEMDATLFNWSALLAPFDWLHICGITLAVGNGPAACARAAVAAAKASGTKISFDCNYRASLWAGREEEASALFKEMASHADLLFAGHRDVSFLCGQTIEGGTPDSRFAQTHEMLLSAFPAVQAIATTHREVTSSDINVLTGFYGDRQGSWQSVPRALEHIVDRIGGGDAFAAGVLHQVGKAKDGQEVIDFALAAAALKHSLRGDFNLMREAEVLALMASNGGDVQR